MKWSVLTWLACAVPVLAQQELRWEARSELIDPRIHQSRDLTTDLHGGALVELPWSLPDPREDRLWDAVVVGVGEAQLARLLPGDVEDGSDPIVSVDGRSVELGPRLDLFSGEKVRLGRSGQVVALFGEDSVSLRWTSLRSASGGRATVELLLGPGIGLRPQYLHLSKTARDDIAAGLVFAEPLAGIPSSSLSAVEASALVEAPEISIDLPERHADGPPPLGCDPPPFATWCDQAGATDAGCVAAAGNNGNTDCATRNATTWQFFEGAFCRDCPYTFYVLVDCGREMHLPLLDMEGADVEIRNATTGQPVSLTCWNETAIAYAAGTNPNPMIQGDCCADQPGNETWWGPPFDETDSDGPGRVAWGFPDCDTLNVNTCADLPGCGGEIPGISPGERQVMDCFISDESGLCGLYRVDISSGGFGWSLFANCDGTATPSFPIFFDCTEAWTAHQPRPELAISNLTIGGSCDDVTVSFEIDNIGCDDQDGDVRVRVTTGCTPADEIEVLVPGPIPAGGNSLVDIDLTTTCGATTVDVVIDPLDEVLECVEDAAAAACRAQVGMNTLSTTACDCNATLTAAASAPVRACVGQTITLDASASTLTPCAQPLYRWLDASGVELAPESTSPTLDLPFGGCPGSVTYTLEVRCFGEACAETTTVTVACHDPSAAAGADQVACAGDDVLFDASTSITTGCPSPEYRWLRAGAVVRDWAADPTATLSGVTTSEAGDYTVELRCSDGDGCTVSDTLTLSVVALTADAGVDQRACSGAGVTLSAIGSSVVACASPEYRWRDAGGAVLQDWSASTDLVLPNVSSSDTGDYTLDLRCGSLASCEVSDTVQLTVIELVANAGSDVRACTSESVTLSGSSSTNSGCSDPEYRWLDAGGTVRQDWSSTSDLALASVTTADAGTFTLELRCATAPSCTQSDTVDLTVLALVADAGSDQRACAGDAVTLSAAGSATFGCSDPEYRWLDDGGVVRQDWSSTSDLALASVATADAGTFTLELRCATAPACTQADTVDLTVLALVADAGADRRACAGDDLVLSAAGSTVVGCSDPEYRWLDGGVVRQDWSTSTDLSLTSVSSADTGDFVVELRCATAPDCTQSDTADLTVLALVAEGGADQRACQGDAVTLSAAGSATFGCSDPQYRWLDAGGAVRQDWSAASELVLASVTTADTDTFTVELRCATAPDCTQSDTVDLTVLALTADAGVDQRACAGDDIVVSAAGSTAVGCADPEYRWRDDEGVVRQDWSASPDLALTNVGTFDTGDFVVDVRCGTAPACTQSDTMSLTVLALIARAGDDQRACAGETVTFSAAGSTTLGCSDPEYRWLDSSGAVRQDWSATSELVIASAGTVDSDTFTVELRCATAPACTQSDTVDLVVVALSADAGSDQRLCAGSDLALSAAASPTTGCNDPEYRWLDDNGVVRRDWSSDPTFALAGLAPTDSGDFTVELRCATTPSCETSDAVTVTVLELVADASGDITACAGSATTLDGSATNVQGCTDPEYRWLSPAGLIVQDWSAAPSASLTDLQPSDAGEYTLETRCGSAPACPSSDTTTLVVTDLVASAGADVRTCVGGDVLLDASASTVAGCNDPEYRWLDPSGVVLRDWSPDATFLRLAMAPSQAGTHAVELRCGSGAGCLTSDSMDISLVDLAAMAGVDQLTCAGADVTLSGAGSLVAGCGSPEYRWRDAAGSVLSDWSSTAELTLSSVDVTDAGAYTLDLRCSVSPSCETSDVVALTVVQLGADAGADLRSCAGEAVTFDASASSVAGCGDPEYRFTNASGLVVQDWSNDSNFVLADPSAADDGLFTVDLRCASLPGCEVSDQVTLSTASLALSGPSSTRACAGSDVVLTGDGSASLGCFSREYRWRDVDGSVLRDWSADSDHSLIGAALSAAGDYILDLRCADLPDCVESLVVPVTIVELGALAGADQRSCLGGTVLLDAAGSAVSSCATPEHRWTDPSGAVLSDWSTSPMVSVDVTDASATGDYLLELRCASDPDCASSDIVRIEAVEVTALAGGDLSSCVGNAVDLTATPSVLGCPSPEHRWLDPSGDVRQDWSAATDLRLGSLAFDDGGSWTVESRCSTEPGCVHADVLVVDLLSLAPSAGGDVRLEAGTPVTLSAAGSLAGSCPDPEYRWLRPDGSELTSWSSDTDTSLTPSAHAEGGDYVVEMRCVSTPGCIASDVVRLTVVTMTLDAGSDLSGCPGESVPVVDAIGSVEGCSGLEYRWLDAGTLTPVTAFAADPAHVVDLLDCASGPVELLLEARCLDDTSFVATSDLVVSCHELPAPVPSATPGCGARFSSVFDCGVDEPGTTWTWDLDPLVDSDGNGTTDDDVDASGCTIEVDRPVGDHFALLTGTSAGGCRTVAGIDLNIPSDSAPGPSSDLRVSKSGDDVLFTWSAATQAGSYRVLRGTLGAYYAETPVQGASGGCNVETLTGHDPGGVAEPTSFYYLIQALSPCELITGPVGTSFDGDVSSSRPAMTGGCGVD
ncbi:MAG: hypothetical protein AAF533_05700 [Acidobacteriota bacterium]